MVDNYKTAKDDADLDRARGLVEAGKKLRKQVMARIRQRRWRDKQGKPE